MDFFIVHIDDYFHSSISSCSSSHVSWFLLIPNNNNYVIS